MFLFLVALLSLHFIGGRTMWNAMLVFAVIFMVTHIFYWIALGATSELHSLFFSIAFLCFIRYHMMLNSPSSNIKCLFATSKFINARVSPKRFTPHQLIAIEDV
jgi:hypothetical protein